MAETIIARKQGKKSPGMRAIDADDEDDAEVASSGPEQEIPENVGVAEGNSAEDAEAAALDMQPEGDEGGEDMGDYESIEDSATADMMAAAKSGDAEMFKTALRDFVQACIARGGSEA